MNGQKILRLAFLTLLVSCGTKRVTVNSHPTNRVKQVVTVSDKKSLQKLPQLEQIKKKRVAVTPRNTEDYIQKFAPIAMEEMQRYKIPASITLAQGILESGSGLSDLAIRSNNHFGIKCHKGWNGKSVSHDDDSIAECFRKYKHPKGSYEDHSKFLVYRKRYAPLFKLKITNYKGWAYGLKRAGYATDPKYPHKLIRLIKKYNLIDYDKEVIRLNDRRHIETEVVESNEEVSTQKYHEVKKGDTLYSIAKKHNISVLKIKQLNNLSDNTIVVGQQLLVY